MRNSVVFFGVDKENVLGVLYETQYDDESEMRKELIGLFFSIYEFAEGFGAHPYSSEEPIYPPESGSLLLNFYLIFPTRYELNYFVKCLGTSFR